MTTDRKMRRWRQQLPQEDALRILREGKYAVMAVEGDDGYPYAVPVNYVFDGEGAIFIHSAAQGHKVDALERNPKCSLCVVDKDDVVPEEFTSYFRSVIAFGRASTVDSTEDKFEALKMLSEKYSSGIDPAAEIDRFIKVVRIIRIDIDSLTGKEAIELTRARNTSDS